MTGEGARGQEYDAWSADGGNPPEHTTVLPFTRLLAGPMDFTPGIFDVLYPEYRPSNRVDTTLPKQVAPYFVIYSPLQMVPDLPKNCTPHADAFQFIRDVPCDWHRTPAGVSRAQLSAANLRLAVAIEARNLQRTQRELMLDP